MRLPSPGLRWLDVGCGNGAFMAMLAERRAPAGLDGADPSAAQLAYARQLPGLAAARFEQGDAMALPYADDAFDRHQRDPEAHGGAADSEGRRGIVMAGAAPAIERRGDELRCALQERELR